MRKALPLPSQATLKLLLDYNPETGELTRRMNAPRGKRGGGNYVAGDIATCLHKPTGYLRVCIGKTITRANRIIWMWMTGEDPGDLVVDHKNRVRSDNRWCNLRLAAAKRKDRRKGMICNQGNRTTAYQTQTSDTDYINDYLMERESKKGSRKKRGPNNKVSRFRGVYPNGSRWRAIITRHFRSLTKTFDTQEEAASQWNQWALEFDGPTAYQNSIDL